MILNGVIALIFRYFNEFGSFRGALRKRGSRWGKKSLRSLAYLISWWVSCRLNTQEMIMKTYGKSYMNYFVTIS